jgi:pimeloyl-ACP methyl ester carboxylesterase
VLVPAVTTDDGTSIAFASTGDGPPNLLFMHGWAGSGRYFEPTIAQLDRTRLRAVTMDIRGHGASDPSADGYTLDRLAADALAVADAAGLEQLVVVGFSMSAKFAQYVSLVAPQRIAGLILVAGCPVSEIPIAPELIEDWYGREGDAQRMADIALPYMSKPVERELLERFGHDAATIRRPALEGTMNAAIATSFATEAGSIAAPVLVVAGSHDPMFVPDMLRESVVAPLARARLALLDAGHEIPIEAPGELAALIEAFLAPLA